MVVSHPREMLPSASLNWNVIYPLSYENEYVFQSLRLFLLFIKGLAFIYNLWLSPFFQCCLCIVLSMFINYIWTCFLSESWEHLHTVIQLLQTDYFLIFSVIFLTLISALNSAAPVMQNGNLFQVPSYFTTLNPFPFLLSFTQSVLPRHPILHHSFSQGLPKLRHGAVCLRVSSFLLPSLDQICACIPSPGKMSAPTRSLHSVLNLILRDCKNRVFLWTGFKLNEFSKWATSSSVIINWELCFR